VKGTFLVHAVTDDDVVHQASFAVSTPTDMTLFFDCRKLLVDGKPALAHLRGDNDEVSCMACVARAAA
jgi:hypothetical protein